MDQAFRTRQIDATGASADEVAELLAYNENHFDLGALSEGLKFPLEDEVFVECWQDWADQAGDAGPFEVLRHCLPQLSFPIVEGMSQNPSYRKATLQGANPKDFEEASGLEVEDPASIELSLYQSLAGRVPVLELYGRQQFVALVRALSRRNEPFPVPDSMGAQMVVGFNNWYRIQQHQVRWMQTPDEEREHATWPEQFAAIRQDKGLYQDRFMLLSDGPYSAVPAKALGLEEKEWRTKSFKIRREHECTHYFTRRVFGSMRNNLLDELMADYAGIVASEGHFRADWFLRFVGLEAYPNYRQGARLEMYRGDPALSDGAFKALQHLVVAAARNLEAFDRTLEAGPRSARQRALVLAALAAQRLDEFASEQGVEFLQASIAELESKIA